MQVIKTSECMIVETQFLFEVDQLTKEQMEEVSLEYSFGGDKLLINVASRQFKNLKTLFKQKSKMETLKMLFLEKKIDVSGEINTKVNYSIST